MRVCVVHAYPHLHFPPSCIQPVYTTLVINSLWGHARHHYTLTHPPPLLYTTVCRGMQGIITKDRCPLPGPGTASLEYSKLSTTTRTCTMGLIGCHTSRGWGCCGGVVWMWGCCRDVGLLWGCGVAVRVRIRLLCVCKQGCTPVTFLTPTHFPLFPENTT